MLSVVSFNVNSIRQRMHSLKVLIDRHNPDVIGLQETKVTDEDFPEAAINALGYHVHYHGQKTHYGVALLSKMEFAQCRKGFATDTEDSQRRLIVGQFVSPTGKEITVINGYFPQGENREHPVKFPAKEKFYRDLTNYLQDNHSPDEAIIVMGDMNIAPDDKDIGIGEDNRKRWLKTGKCSFLPEEREWFATLQSWGLYDSFRQLHPTEDRLFSWFDYRSGGFNRDPKSGLRIDCILVTQPLMDAATGAGIDYTIRAMEKPSDHCPVWATLKI